MREGDLDAALQLGTVFSGSAYQGGQSKEGGSLSNSS
jgi:hypothetical protein